MNKLIEDFDDNKYIGGIEVFQDELLERIRAGGLLTDDQWFQCEQVVIHVDNREGSMCIPIDAHDLALRIAQDGFVLKKWNALACDIPSNDLGDWWKAKNTELIMNSDGLLPDQNMDMAKIATARGSHGTTAMKICKYGCKGVHEQMILDGHVSSSKICEWSPSMQLPLTKGMPYTVIKSELVMKVPRLMEVLSRTGNNTNVNRVQTSLQHCNRIHSLAMARQQRGEGDTDWNEVAVQACLGMGHEFKDEALKLCEFVLKWSGGSQGQILKELQVYEQSLSVKRKLAPMDLKQLAKVELVDAGKYVPAMVKAMLTSPTADATGHSNLFSTGDYQSLSKDGRNVKFATEGNEWMIATEKFLKAYSRLDPPTIRQIASELEVRIIMHIHQKKIESRRSFASLADIGKAAWDTAKHADKFLPVWPKISRLIKHSPAGQGASVAGALVETRDDGSVPHEEMLRRGFTVGKKVVNKESKVKCIIEAIGKDDDEVILKTTVDHLPETSITVTRRELVKEWDFVEIIATEVYSPNTGVFTSPLNCEALRVSIVEGYAKDALWKHYHKCGDSMYQIHKRPEIKVTTLRSIPEGKLVLVALSNKLSVLQKTEQPQGQSLVVMDDIGDDAGSKLVVNYNFVWPERKNVPTGFAKIKITPFMPAYWVVTETSDNAEVNMERSMVNVKVKILAQDLIVKVPVMTNIVPLKDGDQLKVIKMSKAPSNKRSLPSAIEYVNEVVESPIKKSKGKDKGKGKGTSKGTGKGKMKTQGRKSKAGSAEKATNDDDDSDNDS